ncbi:Malonyl-coenzyme A:anthocyanin 3-O-glucoside-6''-O-malonyltransferase [Morus notabilis]|uniref:Malonyl-coenzyme A:anthocyanin 3-O-glucoside-6''-O-malonyltransferase n=1 Tax=Morus notabilis TaxID=981085 RepID=W9RJY8_9ROSA|nr:coumaroyl-CoA:anthocyanidin 3-O-glucoside-6''-O-coumaroyltransferase 1 [Morus notabilis]EXB94475.1 Malonyl-coenzyme A:anthocyanin 3-O-glucoside-6''-O-malonyltransferase [Morus notabilis]
MAPKPNKGVIVIEQSKVSPPPGSVPTTTLPLSFLDVPWLLFPHMQRPYFFEYPHSTHHFLQTLLPSLKSSLSLTLQHFFPFAANLVRPPPPAKLHILFTDGDSVSLTVAESAADFHYLSAPHPLPVRALDPFIPKLSGPTPVERGGDALAEPVLALQITVFPNSGICIGVRFSHVVADGRAFHHFFKSWALLCKTGGDLTQLNRELRLPSHDRAAVKDQYGLELEFLETWRSLAPTWSKVDEGVALRNVRAAFALSQSQIVGLKRWLTNQLAKDDDFTSFHMSSFVVICSVIWICLAKSEERNSTAIDIKNDEPYHFAFVADCRKRLQFPLPITYFGNCLTVCFASVNWKELVGENGFVAAAKAIGKEVGEMNREALKELENWIMRFKKIKELGLQHVTVVGSPKFGIYETDFGLGRPVKTEPIHFNDSNTIALYESCNDKGGVGVSLALSRVRMSRFSTILEEILKELA